jgi:hypothetical protein
MVFNIVSKERAYSEHPLPTSESSQPTPGNLAATQSASKVDCNTTSNKGTDPTGEEMTNAQES